MVFNLSLLIRMLWQNKGTYQGCFDQIKINLIGPLQFISQSVLLFHKRKELRSEALCFATDASIQTQRTRKLLIIVGSRTGKRWVFEISCPLAIARRAVWHACCHSEGVHNIVWITVQIGAIKRECSEEVKKTLQIEVGCYRNGSMIQLTTLTSVRIWLCSEVSAEYLSISQQPEVVDALQNFKTSLLGSARYLLCKFVDWH